MTQAVKRDLRSVLAVAILLAAVATVFPYEAFRFVPDRAPKAAPAFASFVTLTDDGESAAIKAATTSWQTDLRGRRRSGPDLRLADLPSDPNLFRLPVPARPQAPVGRFTEYGACAYSPSERAPDARSLPCVAEKAPPPPFSREQLLKID